MEIDMNDRFRIGNLVLSMGLCLALLTGFSHALGQANNIDEKVKGFLESMNYRWRDMNVPEVDGKALYDLVIEHNYKQALEVGTSTGRSTIWIAWALSKTGGKLTTIEIDQRRYDQAVRNFEKAGLSEIIDARLADAHELVPKLEGPFDFVFIDADKGWYTNYAEALVDKLEVGGCLTAHNVSDRSGRRSRRSRGGTGEFLEYIKGLTFMETTVFQERRSSGLSISYKIRGK